MFHQKSTMNNSGNNKGKKSPAMGSTHSHVSATSTPSVAAPGSPMDISISSSSSMDISSPTAQSVAASSSSGSNIAHVPPKRVRAREGLVVNFSAGGNISGGAQKVGDVEVCNSAPGVVSPVLSNGGEFNINIVPNKAEGNQKIGNTKFGNVG